MIKVRELLVLILLVFVSACDDVRTRIPAGEDGPFNQNPVRLLRSSFQGRTCVPVDAEIILDFEGTHINVEETFINIEARDFWLGEHHMNHAVKTLLGYTGVWNNGWGALPPVLSSLQPRITNVVRTQTTQLLPVRMGPGLSRLSVLPQQITPSVWEPSGDLLQPGRTYRVRILQLTDTLGRRYQEHELLDPVIDDALWFETCRNQTLRQSYTRSRIDLDGQRAEGTITWSHTYDEENHALIQTQASQLFEAEDDWTAVYLSQYNDDFTAGLRQKYFMEEDESVERLAERAPLFVYAYRYNRAERRLLIATYNNPTPDQARFVREILGPDGQWLTGDETQSGSYRVIRFFEDGRIASHSQFMTLETTSPEDLNRVGEQELAQWQYDGLGKLTRVTVPASHLLRNEPVFSAQFQFDYSEDNRLIRTFQVPTDEIREDQPFEGMRWFFDYDPLGFNTHTEQQSFRIELDEEGTPVLIPSTYLHREENATYTNGRLERIDGTWDVRDPDGEDAMELGQADTYTIVVHEPR